MTKQEIDQVALDTNLWGKLLEVTRLLVTKSSYTIEQLRDGFEKLNKIVQSCDKEDFKKDNIFASPFYMSMDENLKVEKLLHWDYYKEK